MKTSLSKRLLSLLLVLCMVLPMAPAVTLPTKAATTDPVVVIAGSDYQANTNDLSAANVKNLLTSIKNNGGYSGVDGFLFAGDYSNGWSESYVISGVASLKGAVDAVYPGMSSHNAVYVQGNHDAAYEQLSASGDHDTDAYGVFVINEDDFQWSSESTEARVLATGNLLRGYLNEKIANAYTKPIFVVSHVPLHYTMRTRANGDSQYAEILYNILYAAADAGLNIIFMYGHNHSGSWEDSHGGTAVFYNSGTLNIAENGNKRAMKVVPLNFTYMNAGYVGYYTALNTGVDTTLNMSVFEITADTVKISRYDANGLHNLKSAGVPNTGYTKYTESDYFQPNTTVVSEPQTITLNKTVDTSKVMEGVEVKALASQCPAGFNYYQSYDITYPDYTDGTETTVILPAGPGLDQARKVFVIDNEKNVTVPATIESGSVKFTADHFSIYTVAQMEESVATAWKAGSLETYLLTTLTGEELLLNEPYIITEGASDDNYVYMVTGDSTTDGTRTGLYVAPQVDRDTAHVWYYDGTYLRYGSADGKYVLLNDNNITLSATLDADAAAKPVHYSLTSSRTFNFQRGDDTANYLNRYGGGTSTITDLYNSPYYSRWYMHRIVTGVKASAMITADQTVAPVGGTIQLTPSASLDFSESSVPDTEAKTTANVTVTWSTSDSSIATVDQNGLVTAVAPGQVYIRATLNTADGSALTSVSFADILITVEKITENDSGVTATTHYGQQIGAQETPTDGNVYVVNFYSDPKWYLTGEEMLSSSDRYNGHNNIEGLEVTPYLPLYSGAWYFDGTNLFHGHTADPEKYLVYDGTKVTIGSNDGTNELFYVDQRTYVYWPYLTAGSVDNTSKRLNHYGGYPHNVAGLYGGSNFMCFYPVTLADQVVALTVSPNNNKIVQGTTLALETLVTANSVPKADYVVEWSSNDTSIATVDSNGIVTGVGVGSTTVVAALTALDGNDLTAPLYLEVPVEVLPKTDVFALTTTTDPYLSLVEDPQDGVAYIVTSNTPRNLDWVMTNTIKVSDCDTTYSGPELLPLDQVGNQHVWYLETETADDGTVKRYLRYGNLTDTDNYLIVDGSNHRTATLGSKSDATYDQWTADSDGSYTPYATSLGRYLNQLGGRGFDTAVSTSAYGTSAGSRWRFNLYNESVDIIFQAYFPSGEDGEITLSESVTISRLLKYDGSMKSSSSFKVAYESSDSTVAMVTSGGVVVPKKAGQITVKVTLTEVYTNGSWVDFSNEGYSVYVPVTVHGVSSVTVNNPEGYLPLKASYALPVGAMNEDLPTPMLTVTYTDGTTEQVPLTGEYLRTAAGAKVSTLSATTYEGLQIVYKGVTSSDTFKLNITTSDLPDYPDYPAPGSVVIDKTASGVNFQSSGLAQVELSTNGIPAEKGADVIIMLDTSSSMSYTTAEGSETRINVLCESLNNMLNTFQEKRADGTDQDIRVAIADFNGNYTDPTSPYYLDPNDYIKQSSSPRILDTGVYNQVFTSPTNSKSADAFVRVQELGENPFTTYHNYQGETNAKYTLRWRSGTNYDYAFDAIYELGQSIKDANAANNESRDLYVIFMSDGVPYQYNYLSSYRKAQWNNWIMGTFTQDMYATYANQTYYNAEGKHWMAEAIKGDPEDTFNVIRKNDPRDEDGDNWITVNGLGATMYSIGFCIEDDIDKDENGDPILTDTDVITEETAKDVLRRFASKSSMVHFPDTPGDLTSVFDSIAGDIMYAISDAYFIDTMGPEFDLKLGNHAYELQGTATTFTDNKIQVTQYEIWLPDDAENGLCAVNQIGTRKPANEEYPKILETVTFNADGTAAYSDVIGAGTNILTGGLICAETFWYNSNQTATAITLDNGKIYSLPAETFYWKVGSIDTKEMALSYYVYLSGSMEGTRDPGTYDTNTSAVLYYENYLGHDCHLVAPVPNMPWGGGQVGYGFYLVDKNGIPIINSNGQTGSFQLAVKPGTVTYQSFNTNSEGKSLTAKDLIAGILPSEYRLFDTGARYDVTLNGDGAGTYRVFTADDSETPVLTTYITGLSSTAECLGDYEGTEVTTSDYVTGNTVAWFAVVLDVEVVNDTIVVDFGLDVDIHPHANDTLMNGGNTVMVGIGDYVGDDMTYTETAPNFGMKGTVLDLKHGKVTFRSYSSTDPGSTCFRYTMDSTQMPSEDTFSYAVQYQGSAVGDTEWDVIPQGYYYANVTVIPATSIYYEDSFVSLKSYTTVKASQYGTGTAEEDSTSKWTTVGEDAGLLQDEERPGQNPTGDSYGSDNAYYGTENATYSMGAAKKLTVGYLSNGDGTYSYTSGTAEFTFWGTGFDVISMTDSTTGTIMVRVYDADTGASLANYMVDTYYGYRFDTTANKWVEDSSASDKLYQVPVMKVDMNKVIKVYDDETTDVDETEYYDYGYGHYKVVITASYNYLFNHDQISHMTAAEKGTLLEGYNFYLDAIRIYDPANNGSDNQVIQDAYVADYEGWPVRFELRDMLLSAADYANLGTASTNTGTDGILFIDGIPKLSSDTATGVPGTEDSTVTNAVIADYANFGPNNELYLAPGQSVTFNIANDSNIAKITLAAKSVGGTAKMKVSGTKTKTFTVDSAYDVRYILTGRMGTDVTITNAGASGAPVLSLTNLTVTYKTAPVAASSGVFTVRASTGTNALNALNGAVETLVQPTLKLAYPTLSFEDEILYNVYFSAENTESVEQLGLLTFDSELTDGTVDNCTGNYPAALGADGLYLASTDGVAAKKLGDTVYFKAYAKLTDGTYVYSELRSYSAKQYAQSQLTGGNEAVKPLVVAMLNYGAAAQQSFSYRTETLVNADLTAEQLALVVDYSTDMFSGIPTVDTAKAGDFAVSSGFAGKYPTVSFEGAFSINYYFTPGNTVDGDMTLYCWTQETYDTAEALTADNALILTMSADESGVYHGCYDGIAAKDLGDNVYVAAVYEFEGVRYCTGVLGYSVGAYCKSLAEDPASALNTMAKATAVYAHYAEAYFTAN